jgi:uncharacterized integral membrane protein
MMLEDKNMNGKIKETAKRLSSRPRLVAGLVVATLIIVVILQNLEPVTLDFLLWNLGPFSKLWLIVGSIAVGAGAAEAIRFVLKRT